MTREARPRAPQEGAQSRARRPQPLRRGEWASMSLPGLSAAPCRPPSRPPPCPAPSPSSAGSGALIREYYLGPGTWCGPRTKHNRQTCLHDPARAAGGLSWTSMGRGVGTPACWTRRRACRTASSCACTPWHEGAPRTGCATHTPSCCSRPSAFSSSSSAPASARGTSTRTSGVCVRVHVCVCVVWGVGCRVHGHVYTLWSSSSL